MNLKIKKGFISELLSDLDIKFNNCGISQQSFEYLRDGKHVRESVINRLEEKCNILRNLDFPIEGVKLSNFDNARIINFIDEPLTYSPLESLMNNIKLESKNNEIINPNYIDLLMHKLSFETYLKVKTLDFKTTLWATDVPQHSLTDTYTLTPPQFIPDNIKLNEDIKNWHDLPDIDSTLLEPITLQNLLSKFNDEFIKKEKHDLAPKPSKDLFSAINKKLEQPVYGDQMQYILAYLESNKYEFQYNIKKFVEIDKSFNSDLNAGVYTSTYEKETKYMKKSEKHNFGRLLAEKFDKSFKNFSGFNETTFMKSIYSEGREFSNAYSNLQNDSIELEDDTTLATTNPYGLMCRRYRDDLEERSALGHMEIQKTYYQLNIALVKKDTINFAMLEKELLQKKLDDVAQYGEKPDCTNTNFTNSDFHGPQFKWRTSYVLTYRDGMYIPKPVPIISEGDLLYFSSKKWTSIEDLVADDINIIKKQLNLMLAMKEFFPDYIALQDKNNTHYLDKKIKILRDEKNIFLRNYCENDYAQFESYLAYLAKSYKYYYNKAKPAEFRELMMEEVSRYYKIFKDEIDEMHKVIKKSKVINLSNGKKD